MKTTHHQHIIKIKWATAFFMILLILSGVTAFPLQTELNWLTSVFGADASDSGLNLWLYEVTTAINHINLDYPFLSYGTDWLAFAHIIISIFFIGVYNDPVRNKWVTTTGIIACLLVFPLAFIAGATRGIPLFWQLIDCSFGALGLIPLLYIQQQTKQIITLQ